MNEGFFAELERQTAFYFIRHGQSEGNIAGILQGRLDYPLTAAGREQAAERGRSLQKMLAPAHTPRAGIAGGRTLFYASPLSRAAETAQIIAAELLKPRPGAAGIDLPPPVFLEDLQELDLGSWTGKVLPEMPNADPELWRRFQARSWDAVPGAESAASLYDRATRVWTALREGAKKSGAETVIVITHHGIIQWMIKTTFGVRAWFPLIPISNCGLSKLWVEPIPGQTNAHLAWEMINQEINQEYYEKK
ncbi:phosphoglycerate mutase [Spirochaetia bacterium]|nr:phosphoglycerate mutase [Spirochaetia bacterium]